jgi:hypothetical protein
MIKINLSALKKDTSNDTNNEVEEKWIVLKQNIKDVKETKEEEVEVENNYSVKISLKDLKIYPETQKKEKIEVKESVFSTDSSIEEPIISNNLKIEEANNSEVEEKWLYEDESSQHQEVINIVDSDTNISIIQDNKEEIFSNYKWSYAKVKDETKQKIETKKEEIKIEKNEIIAELKEAVIPESEIIEKKEEKTNLEKYKNWIKKWINFKIKFNKKLISWVSLIVICILAGTFTTINLNKTKSNIQEINTVLPENTNLKNNVIPENNIDVTALTEDKENNENIIIGTNDNSQVIEKNNLNDNSDIVKENTLTNIDNGQKSNTINKNVESYLIKKYKSN